MQRTLARVSKLAIESAIAPAPEMGATSTWRSSALSGAFLLALCIGSTVSLSAKSNLSGDADRGADLYRTSCGGCHALKQNRIGPRHAGVVGRKAGTQPGYNYSSALADSDIVWSPENLERWLANPRDLVPQTKMAFRVSDAKRRADIVAYLETLDR